MHSVTLEVPFCAGHRLMGHKGKCRHLHGHGYVAKVTVRQADGQLDGMGMVIDFADLKEKVKGWIDANWDHNMVLNQNDPLAKLASGSLGLDAQERFAFREEAREIFAGKKPFLMPFNPTAENMARALATVSVAMLPAEIVVVSVEIQETPTSSATYSC